MTHVNIGAGEMTDEELAAVTGGGIVDTIVGAATKIWNIMTSPQPSGVKGESMGNSRDHIDI